MQENLISMNSEIINSDNSNSKNNKNNDYKILIQKISNSNLKINNDISLNLDEEKKYNGWISFSISFKNLGLEKKNFIDNKFIKTIYTNFMINFIGELLVRSNIEKFTSLIFSVGEEEYLDLVTKTIHKSFGASFDSVGNRIILSFHMSIFQSLLTEDFKH